MIDFHHILPHLPYLAAVARLGSFTQAAESLAVTQSAVSYQIKQLERKLAVRLIVRQSGSHISLTGAGEALAAEYGLMAHRLELTLGELGAAVPAGRLRLSVPVDFGSRLLPPALAHLAREAPALKVELGVSDALIDLKRDPVDMAIRSAPVDDDLIHRPLACATKEIVASPAYLARHGVPAGPGALVAHRLLTRGPYRSPSWQALLATADLKLADAGACQPLGNSFALMEGARAGLGLALLPRFLMTEDLAAGRLVPVPMAALAGMATRFYLSFLPLPQLRLRADLVESAIRQVMAEPAFAGCFAATG